MKTEKWLTLAKLQAKAGHKTISALLKIRTIQFKAGLYHQATDAQIKRYLNTYNND